MRAFLLPAALASYAFALSISLPHIDITQIKRELIGTAEDESDADFPGEKFHNFLSRPDIKAPKFTMEVYNKEAIAPGYWFVAPYHDLHQSDTAKTWVGPYIYDNNAEPVWSGAGLVKHYNVFDFKLSMVNGEPTMNLKYPQEESGWILDKHYQVVNKVLFDKHDEYGDDIHEFNIVDDGAKALIVMSTSAHSTVAQAQEVGLKGNVTCRSLWKGFRELNVSNSEPLFTWDSRDHLSLKESTHRNGPVEQMCFKPGFWDNMHINAVDKFEDGDYLVSSRHTDTLYKINHTDGSVVWRLGGLFSDFTYETPDLKFSRQHHATCRGMNATHTRVGLFDNAMGTGGKNEHPTHDFSRGLLIAINHETKVASIEASYAHPKGGITNSRGSFQTLPNGNAFMGWTYHTLLSEHANDGELLMQASLKLPGHNYRAFKAPFSAQPLTNPDVYAIASKANHGRGAVRTMVYASWNGATDVAEWNLLRSDETGAYVERVATTQRTGFETILMFHGFASHVVVEALDRHGNSLGRSEPFKTIPPTSSYRDALAENANWLQDKVSTDFKHVAAHAAENPFVTFVGGVIFTVSLGLTIWLIVRCWRGRREGGGLAWWRQRKQRGRDAKFPLLEDDSEFGDDDAGRVLYADSEKSHTSGSSRKSVESSS